MSSILGHEKNGAPCSYDDTIEMRPFAGQPKPKRKRVITEKRREQNRQAQKNHREKQKRLLQESQNSQPPPNFEPTQPGIPVSGIHDVVERVRNDWIDSNGSHGDPHSHGHLTTLAVDGLKGPETYSYETEDPINLVDPPLEDIQVDLSSDVSPSDSSWPQEPSTPILNAEAISEQHSWSFQNSSTNLQDCSTEPPFQNSLPYSTPSLISNTSSDDPSPENINLILAANRISIEDIIFAGLESITKKFKKSVASSSPKTDSFNNGNISGQQLQKSTTTTPHAPSPSISHIPLRQMALMAACMENAAHIGIDIYEHIRRPAGHCDGHTLSPFFQPLADTALNSTTIANQYQSIIPDLRPCAAQIKQSHYLYVDVLPFPEIRKRILALRECVTDCEDGEEGGGEKVFDEKEFCRDIDADGIVCWGSDARVGTGAPWDRRSWEMRPWFLKKWWMATGGLDGEMGKQSRWWADMRGEVFAEG